MCKFILIMLAVIGCYTNNPDPETDAIEGGTGGYWKMSECYVKAKPTPVEQVPGKLLMQVEARTVKEGDALGASMYTMGSRYLFFSFFDESVARRDSFQAMRWHTDHYPKYHREVQWHRIKDSFGVLVIVENDRKTGLLRKIQVSNVMKSDNYSPALDTMRMTYLPVDKFK